MAAAAIPLATTVAAPILGGLTKKIGLALGWWEKGGKVKKTGPAIVRMR